MSAAVTVDLIESKSAQASVDVTHYMLLVGDASVCRAMRARCRSAVVVRPRARSAPSTSEARRSATSSRCELSLSLCRSAVGQAGDVARC
jgi:hypothetical protein